MAIKSIEKAGNTWWLDAYPKCSMLHKFHYKSRGIVSVTHKYQISHTNKMQQKARHKHIDSNKLEI